MIAYALKDLAYERIDVDTIAESPEAVRSRVLPDVMGWRYQHPELYSQDEVWATVLESNCVVQVRVTVDGDPNLVC